MTLNGNDNNPVAMAVTDQQKEETESNDHREYSEQSIMKMIDYSNEMKTRNDLSRSSRTRTTATPMAMNARRLMTVCIVCGRRRDTKRVRQQRIQWAVACYTNGYGKHTVSRFHDGVGRE